MFCTTELETPIAQPMPKSCVKSLKFVDTPRSNILWMAMFQWEKITVEDVIMIP